MVLKERSSGPKEERSSDPMESRSGLEERRRKGLGEGGTFKVPGLMEERAAESQCRGAKAVQTDGRLPHRQPQVADSQL